MSEAVLHSMQVSRRLLLVLSPDYLVEKSFSLLECRLAMYLQHSHRATIVAILYRALNKITGAEAVQVRRVATSTVTWRGSQSEPPASRFWKRLRLALPVRPLALGRRMIDSTSSHSDLAALARAQWAETTNKKNRDKQAASATHSHRDRRRLLRGSSQWRGRVDGPNSRELGSRCRERVQQQQHSMSCSCSGFVGMRESQGLMGRGTELTVETQPQQPTDNSTETHPGVGPASDPAATTPHPTPIPDPTPETVSVAGCSTIDTTNNSASDSPPKADPTPCPTLNPASDPSPETAGCPYATHNSDSTTVPDQAITQDNSGGSKDTDNKTSNNYSKEKLSDQRIVTFRVPANA